MKKNDNDITIDKKLPKEKLSPEINGVKGYEPTAYGDWHHKGRVSDF